MDTLDGSASIVSWLLVLIFGTLRVMKAVALGFREYNRNSIFRSDAGYLCRFVGRDRDRREIAQ